LKSFTDLTAKIEDKIKVFVLYPLYFKIHSAIIWSKLNRRELVLQAEREVLPPTDNLIWIMPT